MAALHGRSQRAGAFPRLRAIPRESIPSMIRIRLFIQGTGVQEKGNCK